MREQILTWLTWYQNTDFIQMDFGTKCFVQLGIFASVVFFIAMYKSGFRNTFLQFVPFILLGICLVFPIVFLTFGALALVRGVFKRE